MFKTDLRPCKGMKWPLCSRPRFLISEIHLVQAVQLPGSISRHEHHSSRPIWHIWVCMQAPHWAFPLGGRMDDPGRLSVMWQHRESRGRIGSIWFNWWHRGPCLLIWNPATHFVCNLHGRCLLSLTPGNHAYIHTVNSFRSECIFRTMRLEKQQCLPKDG